jgi:hypothetical protein
LSIIGSLVLPRLVVKNASLIYRSPVIVSGYAMLYAMLIGPLLCAPRLVTAMLTAMVTALVAALNLLDLLMVSTKACHGGKPGASHEAVRTNALLCC